MCGWGEKPYAHSVVHGLPSPSGLGCRRSRHGDRVPGTLRVDVSRSSPPPSPSPSPSPSRVCGVEGPRPLRGGGGPTILCAGGCVAVEATAPAVCSGGPLHRPRTHISRMFLARARRLRPRHSSNIVRSRRRSRPFRFGADGASVGCAFPRTAHTECCGMERKMPALQRGCGGGAESRGGCADTPPPLCPLHSLLLGSAVFERNSHPGGEWSRCAVLAPTWRTCHPSCRTGAAVSSQSMRIRSYTNCNGAVGWK